MQSRGNFLIDGECYDDDDDDYDDEDDYDDDDDDAIIDPSAGVEAGQRRRLQQRFRASLPHPGEATAAAAMTVGSSGWGQRQPQQRSSLAQLQLQEAISSRQLGQKLDELLDRLASTADFDINAPLKNGWTPLMLAAERCNIEMVAALIDKGARADRVSADGTTSLMAACGSGSRHSDESAVLEMIQLLMDCGAKETINTVSARQGTALHLAARFNYPRVVARLLADGAGVDTLSAGSDGRTPLMEAAARGNLRSVEALLSGGAKPDRRDRRGHTAAELAANAGYPRVARLIDSPVGELTVSLAGDGDGEGCIGEVAPSVGSTSADDESAKLDDLSSFFYGIGYPEVANQFRAHSLTFVDLLTTTDSALEKIGVRQVGVRRRILEAVRQLHRRPWRDSSMPQLATGRPPAAADYLAILANLHRHLEFMNATLKYLTDHAEAAAADAAADAAAAKASVASAGQPSAAAAATAAVEAASSGGPADGLRNQRVLARARNSCRLAAGECRRLLGRLETGLAALQRLQPVERPDRLPAIGEAGSNKSVKWNFAAIGVGAAVCAAATVAGFLVAAKRR
ncbi:hypothetical protein BOX15_Mlig003500g5 [Macrostomum lignano]|uniref:SAM domain-containing protein n=1 Tax=Macrostomum lignano TaxID=282301 RepID=A0A267G3B2_9PLAT|nr:hypothetical protein BOX15_Mlig003500g5 [Macrostomum lignano]